MVASSSILALLTALSSAYAIPSPSGLERSWPRCANVQIIVARGSDEPDGQGAMGAVAQSVIKQIPRSQAVGLHYPATLDNYILSEATGTKTMLRLIDSFLMGCYKTKIVLMGYSQGAQVVLDTLCGTSEEGWNSTDPTPHANNILAAITFGDPSHKPGMSYNQGNATRQGVFNRQKPWCTTFADRIQSYCDAGDTFCDNGNSSKVHGQYVHKYGTIAADYVVNKYKG